MSRIHFFTFLGSYNRAYKSKAIESSDLRNFILKLKIFFSDISNITNPNEELLKGKFSHHILNEYETVLNENRIDLSIKKDNKTQAIFEFKSPNNISEMLQENGSINKKALQESIWYFYNQDSKEISYQIKNVVITDTETFFFFNPKDFCDHDLEKTCLAFKNKQVAYNDTKTLYEQISEKIERKGITFDYAVFDLAQYRHKILTDTLNEKDLKQLSYLYKALHPDFLLREFNYKDSNDLNQKFYRELLYILGIEEKTVNTKKLLIPTSVKGTLLDCIYQNLECEDDRKFEASTQLIIVWLNRILFLKLFEAQLISFNNNDSDYAFFNSRKIKTFNKLNQLFFNVLGKPINERSDNSTKKIPYLNSSLFELSDVEAKYNLKISGLDEDTIIKVYSSSVLRSIPNYPDNVPVLKYLLDFLEAYDFSSKIGENNKEIINSSVLGLIFEKLNGYRDGSYFTPGFVTEYMTENAITKLVLERFNTLVFPDKEPCEDIEELKVLMEKDVHKKKRRKLYNSVIDGLRICDPSVGSGHFLVSALNYLIYLKGYLGILGIPNPIDIQNDSLIVYRADEQDEQFKYIKNNTETTNVQRVLFEEKERIIKNCLFGADINPVSVDICRLRLWIELLKNTYYIGNTGEMQILPNIDINIKCGNSLISAFDINVGNTIKIVNDATSTINVSEKDIQEYQELTRKYKDARSKVEKSDAKRKIAQIKKKIADINLFVDTTEYSNSLEWMIEFPELLNKQGKFMGFDLICGNPPYGVSIKGEQRKIFEKEFDKVPDYEIYYYFMELGRKLLKYGGILSYIVPNTFLFNVFAAKYRKKLTDIWKIYEILDCSSFIVFENAKVRNVIFTFSKSETNKLVGYRQTKSSETFTDLVTEPLKTIKVSNLLKLNRNWSLAFRLDDDTIRLLDKLNSNRKIMDVFSDITQGLIAYDRYRGQEQSIIDSRAYHYFEYKEGLKKWLWGEDVTRYQVKWNGKEYIDYCEGIANPRSPHFFIGKRLLIREITNPSIYAAVTDEELYNDPAIIIVKDNNREEIEILEGILNSKLATFYHFNSSPKALKGLFPKILVDDINNFPIPEFDKEDALLLKETVKSLVEAKKHNQNVENIEEKINHIVYRLYNLNDSEIQLVENFFIDKF